MLKYPLTGGLDLVTVKPLTRPGTLRECMNFEVTTVAGYSRLPGIERFDGSEDVGAVKVWRLKYNDSVQYTAGERAWFDPAYSGVVLSDEEAGTGRVVYVLMPSSAPAPGLPADLISDSVTASIYAREPVPRGYGQQGAFNAAVKLLADERRTNVGQVPGRAGSDIIGGFFYKDRVYAIRDLPRIGFQDGIYTDADEGKYVTIEGQDYKILDVRTTGDRQGIITYDTAPGSGTMASPIGTPTLATLPVSGTIDDAYVGVPYTDGLTVSGGVSPYVWSLAGETGGVDPIESPDASAINFLPQITNAALYRSSPTGWQRVDLGRELQFRGGGQKIQNFSRNAIVTGEARVETAATFPAEGKIDGTPTATLGADDGVNASVAAADTTVFEVTDFDFSAIPDNATITGIEVKVERFGDATNTVRDHVVELVGIPNGTSNKARGANWPTVAAVETYGGDNDLWGSQQITPSVVKSTLFGARVVSIKSGALSPLGGIDYITIKVFYVQKDAVVYVWNGTTDVPVTLRHTQVNGGIIANNTLYGYMNIACPTNAAKTRLISDGDQIRTAPSGGGDLIAIAAGRDRPIWLPGQSEIDNNRSRYQFTIANFFGQDEFEAVYGVCGAGPAFAFDGLRCIRVRTELPPQLDLPRHIAKHGDMLVLGYYPGALVFSAPGEPFEMRGEEGASSVELGDRLTNLAPLVGDALVAVCQSSTRLIRGTVPESFYGSPISNRRGGIEYTAVDMGKYVLCDGLGVFVADAAESFGPANRNYVSQPVHPWLAPRLQAKINSESSFLRPVAALNVRNKNQMRLYFWDGWVLTLTMNEPPEFTTQRYFTPAADAHTEPTPWVPRMLCSGIDSSGRERLFVSWYGGVKEGYVFEMDSGRSFDGAPIPANIVLNPVTAGNASQEKRYDRYHLYGTGLGVASLVASRYLNDSDDATYPMAFHMGNATRRARLAASQFRGVVDQPGEAFDISFRFDSNSGEEGDFALQYLELIVTSAGQSRGKQGG